MMNDKLFNELVAANFGVAPAWCSGAVATDNGWVNPKTKEIYSCIPNLKTRIEEFEAEKARRAAIKEEVAPVVEAAPVAVVEEKPVAKKPASKKTTVRKTVKKDA